MGTVINKSRSKPRETAHTSYFVYEIYKSIKNCQIVYNEIPKSYAQGESVDTNSLVTGLLPDLSDLQTSFGSAKIKTKPTIISLYSTATVSSVQSPVQVHVKPVASSTEISWSATKAVSDSVSKEPEKSSIVSASGSTGKNIFQ